MESSPVYTFIVQKLGSESLAKSSNSITSLQKPLKKMYTLYQKNISTNPPLPQFKITAGNQGLTISDCSTFSTENNPVQNNLQINQINKDQILLKAALQFLTTPADKKGKKFKAAFITLDQELRIKHKKEYNALFASLDDKENFLVTMNNPPLFVYIAKINKNVEMQVFVCNNETQALNIVSALNGIVLTNYEMPQQNMPSTVSEVTPNGQTVNFENKNDAPNMTSQSGSMNKPPMNGQPQTMNPHSVDPNLNTNFPPQQNYPNQQVNVTAPGMQPILQNGLQNMNPMQNYNNQPNIYEQIPSNQPPFSQIPNTTQPSNNFQQNIYGPPYMPQYYPPYGNPYQHQPPYGPQYMPSNYPPNPMPLQPNYNQQDMYQQFNYANPNNIYSTSQNQPVNVDAGTRQNSTEVHNDLQQKTISIPRPAIIPNTPSESSPEPLEERFNNLATKPVNPPIPQFIPQHPPNFVPPEVAQQAPQQSMPVYNPYGPIPQSAPVTSKQMMKEEFHSNNNGQQPVTQNNQHQDPPLTAPVQKKPDKIPPIPAKKPQSTQAILNKLSGSSQSEDCTSPVSAEISDNPQKTVFIKPKKYRGFQVLPPMGGLPKKPQPQSPINPNTPQDLSPPVVDAQEIIEANEPKTEVTHVEPVNNIGADADNDFEKSLGYLP